MAINAIHGATEASALATTLPEKVLTGTRNGRNQNAKYKAAAVTRETQNGNSMSCSRNCSKRLRLRELMWGKRSRRALLLDLSPAQADKGAAYSLTSEIRLSDAARDASAAHTLGVG